MKNKRLVILGIIVIVFVFIYGLINKNFFILFHNFPATKNSASTAPPKYNLPVTKNTVPHAEPGEPDRVAPKDAVKVAVDIPGKFLLNVPFIPQAPFGVWDSVHNDACEETALVMAKHWVSGHLLNATIADKEILDAVAWEAKTWGKQYELTADRMAILAKEFFGLENVKAVSDPTIDGIKSELSQGNLVLVPVAGRLLGNPYYRQPGPIYHILVLKGYNEQEFITNDAGTRRGEGYDYSYQTLFNAMHDWPYPAPDFGINIAKDIQAQKILTGGRAMLIIGKN